MTADVFSDYRFLQLNPQAEKPAGAIELVFAHPVDQEGTQIPGKELGDIRLVRHETVAAQATDTVYISLGAVKKASAEAYRKAGGAAAHWLTSNNIQEASLDVSTLSNSTVANTLAALLEGLLLGAFHFDRYKFDKQEKSIPQVTILNGYEELAGLIHRLDIICSAANLARAWAHEPANVINPLTLASRAAEVCKAVGLKCTILDEKKLADLKAGGILGVGMGSGTPPRLIIIEYPGQDQSSEKPVVLVGKALTFDTGGYSIKDLTQIQGMKYDKCGGVDVLAVMLAAAELKLKQPLVGIIGAAENMISGEAYRPDDILTMMSGKTVEIITTDAEGRLVLADCLTYAQKHYDPAVIIDIATLTGGVVVALGRFRAGLFSNNDDLAERLFASGETVYERLWRLPLDEEYTKNILGDDADLKNSGGREGHPVYGGVFLKEFIEDGTTWAHLDIAGVDSHLKDMHYCPKGGSGFGVRLLLNYLENL